MIHQFDAREGPDKNIINWDRPMLDRFKVVLTKANQAKVDTIMFDGNLFDVAYGLYLVEYLETKLKE